MRVCLFEDERAGDLEPLSLTRPVFDLLCGLGPLRDKQWRVFGAREPGAIVRDHLVGVCRARMPGTAVNDPTWLQAGPLVLLNARWLPARGMRPACDRPCVGLCQGEVAYAVVAPEPGFQPDDLEEALERWQGELPTREAPGRMVRYLWELVHLNGEQIRADWEPNGPKTGALEGIHIVGPKDRVCIGPGARVDPFVVADTTHGPVVIEPDAVVSAFTRLEGPCCIGAGTHVLGAKVRAGTTFGPQCRIGGEVECSIVQGHSNKYHDGFLGHAYVGEWVNLGAGTSNSDLRNDYGEVTVVVQGEPVRTGSNKVGCLIGDHTKAGLGTLLNTGSNIGAFCNLLPSGGLLPRDIPSFASWWNGRLVDRASLPELLHAAGLVMGRRGSALTEATAALYRTLFDQTASRRRQAVSDHERRQLRRTA
jgi:UDP-N-acetylglucosamine diphosphorylase/glucosamine-1-phosphate N-acetyltransferase